MSSSGVGGGGLWLVVLQKGVKNCIGEYCVFIIYVIVGLVFRVDVKPF